MSEIKILSYSSCENLLNFKSNVELRENYNNSEFNYNGLKFIQGKLKCDCNIENIKLRTSPFDDAENSIKIFTILKSLDLVQANDKRLWVTLSHIYFYNYVRERWKIGKESTNEVIKDRFHFEGSGLRARNQNSIARLWWAAKITYDETKNDPFELTKILWEKQDLYQNLIDRKLSTYSETLKGFLRFYKMNRHLDLKHDIRKIIKGINAYGGVRVLSVLDEKEVFNQIIKLCKYYRIDVNVS